MKFYYLLITIILLNSCVTITEKNTLEPLWYSDSFSYLSESKHIVFKASGYSFSEAEDIIISESVYLSDFLLPQKVKEFVNSDGIYFLLYSIEKSDLQLVFEKLINDVDVDISNNMRQGDLTSNLIEKYSFYNKALILYESIENILSISNRELINLEFDFETVNKNILDSISFTLNEVAFNVNVSGDIDGVIEAGIKSELHRLGFQTSKDGSVILDTILVLKDVSLDNNYINKFWSVSIALQDLYGESNGSLTFKGRESHLTEESLLQLIAKIVTDRIVSDLNTILP